MNQQTTARTEPDAKRAHLLTPGDHVIEEYDGARKPARVLVAVAYRNGNGRRMVSLHLDTLDGLRPLTVDYPADKLVELATDEQLAGIVTPETVGLDGDLVAHAIHALSPFGPLTLDKADELLSMWARRDQLTDAQAAAVLAYYRPEPVEPTDAQTQEIKARYLKAGMTVIDATDGALIVTVVNRYAADRILVSFEGQPEPTVFGLEVGVIVAADDAQSGR